MLVARAPVPRYARMMRALSSLLVIINSFKCEADAESEADKVGFMRDNTPVK